jgi:tRNA A37 threonylcarbamoyladenosine dehydratase
MKWSFLFGAFLGAGGYAGVLWLRRFLMRKGKEKELAESEDMHAYEDQMKRNYQFFGKGQDDIKEAFVAVIGLGGVGSHVGSMLARSGIGRLRLIDFDVVTPSSLNRHSIARVEDLGKPKAEVLKEYISSFNPFIDVEACSTIFAPAAADTLLGDNPRFVIDCIDDSNTKVLFYLFLFCQIIFFCRPFCIVIVPHMGSKLFAVPVLEERYFVFLFLS